MNVNGIGIWGVTGAMCSGNKVTNFTVKLSNCADAGHNFSQ